jgi:NAD(P)-dependent dehydrogenase (short-subunit alcohol dehydrogenase family)
MSKIIVITGAGAGLGKSLAQRFAAEGETVILLGRTAAKVEALAAQLGEPAMGLGCDVGDATSVRAAFAAIAERHPTIDVLINNAGVFKPSPVVEASDELIYQTLNTNLAGPLLCARSAIPMLRRGGHIINVGSESAQVYFPHQIVYMAAKAGLERMSLTLQRELESMGIRVTLIRAGAMSGEERGSLDMDPAAMGRFVVAAKEAGLDLMSLPVSQFRSVTQVFRAVIDLPADVHLAAAHVIARGGD